MATIKQKTISQLVRKLKETNTDYEFYPTTNEIIIDVVNYVKENSGRFDTWNRVLDIGCGNGNLFRKWDDLVKHLESWERSSFTPTHRFGIEKAQILINEFPENVTLLGTEFWEQSLIDKKMDIIFCNPPYSEYEKWAEKIILEANAPHIALVVPDRWNCSDVIKSAILRRGYKAKVIGAYDFIDAERSARAKVNLIFLNASNRRGGIVDPFHLWFDSTFSIKEEKLKENEPSTKEEQIEHDLINAENIVEQLVSFYDSDMEKIYLNYKAIEMLDSKILKELNVDVQGLKNGLAVRISGLKNLYWNTLFKRYDKITSRLSTFSRQKILDKLYANAVVDFTEKNIFAITHWIIRNANTMYDEQLKDFYLKLSNPKSIVRYKSDKRFNDDDWRYIKETISGYGKRERKTTLKNYMLDYRIVYKGFNNYSYRGLSEETFDLISDMLIIAQNLGFVFTETVFPQRYWDTEKGTWSNFDLCYADGKTFVNVKLYQNGNKHFKFDTEFMKKLNIEAARLNGWVKSPQEAVKELEVNESLISAMWGCNKRIRVDTINKLLLA